MTLLRNIWKNYTSFVVLLLVALLDLTCYKSESSVTITSICNACVFFASYMIPIEALQACGVQSPKLWAGYILSKGAGGPPLYW